MEHSHWYYCMVDVASVVRWFIPAFISIGVWELAKSELCKDSPHEGAFFTCLFMVAIYLWLLSGFDANHFWLTP